jgi:hypothetical protein
MAEIYRNLLVIVCLGLLGWGLIRIERIYQYPFFMGAIFISFLVPQAFALVENPGVLDQQSLERVLLMSSLCAVACWVGYQGKPNAKWLAKLNVDIDTHKLFRAAIFLMIIGYFFDFLLKSTTVELTKQGQWTGPATIYVFFSQVSYLAFSIFLLETLKRPSVQNIIFTLLAGWIPLQTVLAGRRHPTMTFLIIIGLCFWLIRRYIPPRWLIILAIFAMLILIPTIGAMREGLWDAVFSGQWQTILSTTEKALNTQQKGKILELRNAAFLIKATTDLNLYGLGAGWWDTIIHQFIPGQILGIGFKESLKFDLINSKILYNLYGYNWHVGTTPTGVGDSFREFGYFGFFAFALIGYLFKNLWISLYYQKSLFSSLIYLSLISPAMLGLTHGISFFLNQFIFQLTVVSLIVYYSRIFDKIKYRCLN